MAIATRRLEAGTRIRDEAAWSLCSATPCSKGPPSFAVAAIAADRRCCRELPWLRCTRPARRLRGQREHAARAAQWSLDATLPDASNFVDRITPYQLDKAALRPAPRSPPTRLRPTFDGYAPPVGAWARATPSCCWA
ncbi:MAG: hypothetical protein R2851_24820 [Caldilineaceae bacterium]